MTRKAIWFFTLSVLVLFGCDTGNTTRSTQGGDEAVGNRYTDINQGATGSIYYSGPEFYQRLDMNSGIVTSLRTDGAGHWSNPDGTRFTSVYDTDDYDYDYLKVFDSIGLHQWGFRFPEGSLRSQPKLSPDGELVAVLIRYSRDERGLYLYDREGSLVRQFLEEPEPSIFDDEEDTASRFADIEWLPDGSLLAFFGGGLAQLPAPVSSSSWEIQANLGDTLPDNLSVDSGAQRIAFDQYGDDGNRHIFVINLDGSGLRQLTTSDTHEYDATWSPDGNRLAFRHGESWLACPSWGVCYGDCPALFMIPEGASKAYVDDDNPVAPAVRVQEVEDNDTRGVCAFSPPEWRPEPEPRQSHPGTVIDQAGLNRGLTGKLYYGGLDNTPVTVDLATGAEEALPVRGRNPYISRNGGDLVVEQGYPIVDANSDDRIMIVNSEGVVQNSFYVAEDYSSELPTLSPDGQWIAMEWSPSYLDGGGVSTVTLFDREGLYRDRHRFKNYGDWDWMPDGRLLLEKNGEIFLTDSSLSNPQKIGELPENISNIEISPNGSRLAFKMLNHIWTSQLDGSELKQLTTSREWELNPTWSADGRYIATRYDEFQVYAIPSDAEMVYLGEDEVFPGSAFRLRFNDPERDGDIRGVSIFSTMYWR